MQARFFVSRYHDYAEIESPGEEEEETRGDGGDRMETVNTRPTGDDVHLPPFHRMSTPPNTPTAFTHPSDTAQTWEFTSRTGGESLDSSAESVPQERVTHVAPRTVEHVSARGGREGAGTVPSTQVTRRRAEWIPSESGQLSSDLVGRGARLKATSPQPPELPPRTRDKSAPAPKVHHGPAHDNPPLLPPKRDSGDGGGVMSSSVTQSLEKVGSGQGVGLSPAVQDGSFQSVPVTSSVEPTSQLPPQTGGWLGGPQRESSVGGSVRDVEFFHKVEHALRLEAEGYHRHECAFHALPHDSEELASVTQGAATSQVPPGRPVIPSSSPDATSHVQRLTPSLSPASALQAVPSSLHEATATTLQETHFPTTPDEPCSAETSGIFMGQSLDRAGEEGHHLVDGVRFSSPLLGGHASLPAARVGPTEPDYAEPSHDCPPPVPLTDPDYAMIDESLLPARLSSGGGSRVEPDYAEILSPPYPPPPSHVQESSATIPEYAVIVKRRVKSPTTGERGECRQGVVGPSLGEDSVSVVVDTSSASSVTAAEVTSVNSNQSSSAVSVSAMLSGRGGRSDSSDLAQTGGSSQSGIHPSGECPPFTQPGVQIVRRPLNSSSSSSSESTASTDRGEESYDNPSVLEDSVFSESLSSDLSTSVLSYHPTHSPSHKPVETSAFPPTDRHTGPSTDTHMYSPTVLPALHTPAHLNSDTPTHCHTETPVNQPINISTSSEIPDDLRQFSPQDILWRQNLLRQENSSTGHGRQQESPVTSQRELQGGQMTEDFLDRAYASSPSFQRCHLPPTVLAQQSGTVALQQSLLTCDPSPTLPLPPASPSYSPQIPGGGGGGGRHPPGSQDPSWLVADQGLSAVCPPPPSPSLLAGTSPPPPPPLLPQHTPSPIPQPPLPPHLSQFDHHHHHHPPSQTPLEDDGRHPSLPVHLTLYHPGEFQVPPAAVGMATGVTCWSVGQEGVAEETTAVSTRVRGGQETGEDVCSEERLTAEHTNDSGYVDAAHNRLGREQQAVGKVDLRGKDTSPSTLPQGAQRQCERAEQHMEDSEEEQTPGAYPVTSSSQTSSSVSSGIALTVATTSTVTTTTAVTASTTTATDTTMFSEGTSSPLSGKRSDHVAGGCVTPPVQQRSGEKSAVSGSVTEDGVLAVELQTVRERGGLRDSKGSDERNTQSPVSSKPSSVTVHDPKIMDATQQPTTTAISASQTVTPSTPKAVSSGQTPPCPIPRVRTSLYASHHVAPPVQEVLEVARPSVKRRTSLNQSTDQASTHRRKGAATSVQKPAANKERAEENQSVGSVSSRDVSVQKSATGVMPPDGELNSPRLTTVERTDRSAEGEKVEGHASKRENVKVVDVLSHQSGEADNQGITDKQGSIQDKEVTVSHHASSHNSHPSPLPGRAHSDPERSKQQPRQEQPSPEFPRPESSSIPEDSKLPHSSQTVPGQKLPQQELSGQAHSSQNLPSEELSRQEGSRQDDSSQQLDSFRQPREDLSCGQEHPDPDNRDVRSAMEEEDDDDFPPPPSPLLLPPSSSPPLFPPPPLGVEDQEKRRARLQSGSRSSLDDSTLQMAAQRADDLAPCWEQGEGEGYSTGSLRSRHSQKMRSLMGVFERGEGGAGESDSASESGLAVGCNHGDGTDLDRSFPLSVCVDSDGQESGEGRVVGALPPHPVSPSHSSSVPTASVQRPESNAERQDGTPPSECETAARSDTCQSTVVSPPARGGFPQPPAGQKGNFVSPVGSKADVSRNNEKGEKLTTGAGKKGDSGGKATQQTSSSKITHEKTVCDQKKLEKTSSSKEEAGTLVTASKTAVKTAANKTHEETANSASETKTEISSFLKKMEETRSGEKPPTETRQEDGSNTNTPQTVHRQESIKELRQMFETSSHDSSQEGGSSLIPPTPFRRSLRMRSVSPETEKAQTPPMPSAMRRSMEIPSSWSILKQQAEPALTSQRLRLGPKPFYGAKK